MLLKKQNPPAFNDGVVRIYSVENAAGPGEKPVLSARLKETLRYERRMVGAQRYYAALQAGTKISLVLRVPRRPSVSPQDIAVLSDDLQYRIAQIQYPPEFPVMDLTLERLEAAYDLE